MKSYFKFLSHNKLYAAIEAFGLSIALAFVIILVSYASMEYRVGTQQKEPSDLYAVGSGDYLGMTWGVPKNFFPSIPEIKEWTRFAEHYTERGAMVGDQYFKVKAMAVDPNFAKIFGYKCRGCNADSILTDTRHAVVSEAFAKKAFGNANPIGQTVKCDDMQFKVVGVMEDFGATDLFKPVDLFVSMKLKEATLQEMDQFGEVNIVVRLAKNADADKVANQLLDKYMAYWPKFWNREKNDVAFMWGSKLVRWDKLYFSSVTNMIYRNGNQTLVNILLVVALVLLLSAIFNYINLTVAQIGNRAKEMATRRLLGESVKGVVWRYLKEAAFFTAVCFLLGALLAWAFVPLFNYVLDTKIALFASFPVVGYLLLAYAMIALLSGLFPAIVVSRLNPIDVVKGTVRLRSKMWFGKVFIVAQNVISMSLVVLALTMTMQMHHLVNLPLGYTTQDLLSIETTLDSDQGQNDVLIKRLKALPEVEEATATANIPFNSSSNGVHDEKGACTSYVRTSVLDSTAMKMMGFKVLERYGDPLPGKLWISEEAKRAYGVTAQHPWIGVREGKPEYEVCGVVADFHCGDAMTEVNNSLHNVIGIPSNRAMLWAILVKTRGDHAQALQAIRNTCRQTAKELIGVPTDMEMEYLDDMLADSLKQQRNTMVLILTFMGISILISALGLFGMSVYYGNQQKQQIAIRKVLGASTRDAAWQLSRRFLVCSVVAIVIAIPVCAKLMLHYLSDFVYRIDTPWWLLAVGAAFTLLVAFLSVIGCTLKTALSNPIDSIKTE